MSALLGKKKDIELWKYANARATSRSEDEGIVVRKGQTTASIHTLFTQTDHLQTASIPCWRKQIAYNNMSVYASN